MIDFKTIFYRNRIAFIVIGLVLAIIPIIGSLIRGEIFCDSAYYICHAQLVAQGQIPYFDFCFGYTPLWLYIAAGLKLLFNIPDGNYVFYLLLHYLFVVGNAFFLYKISRAWAVPKNTALIGSFIYIIMSHWLQGNVLILEPPSIFFGLWSSYVVLKEKNSSLLMYVLSGVLCACSFLCKQFGLGFLALNLFLIIAINRNTWKETLAFLFGYVFLIGICVLYWKEKLLPIVFNGYGTKSAIEGGLDLTLNDRLDMVIGNIKYFAVWVCPATIISLFSIPAAVKQRQGLLLKMVYCYCGIVGFGLQFYFAGDFHYFLYLEPFGVLLMMLMLRVEDKSWLHQIKLVVVVWTVFLSMYKTYKCRVYKWYVSKNLRQEQYDIAKAVGSIIPPKTCVWVPQTKMQYIYLLTETLPPNLTSIGFSFGRFGINESESLEQAESASFIVCDKGTPMMYSERIMGYLDDYHSYTLCDGSVVVFDKSIRE